VTADVDESRQVRYVLIESQRGGHCRIANPWPDKATVTCDGKTIVATAGRELAFPTVAGKTYLLQRAAAPLAKLQAARLAPAPAAGPKVLGKLPAYPQWSGPYLGLDAEGRSPQRATMLRNAQAAAQRVAAATQGKPLVGKLTPTAPVPNGEALQLDLGKPLAVNTLVFARDHTSLFVDRPAAGYVVETSADGQQWQTAVDHQKQGANPAGEVVTFAPVTARYVRLKLSGQYGEPAVIEELAVYGP
jgi:hypothetical protein